jgi:hypothetical protein
MTTKSTPGGSFTEADVDSLGETFVMGAITTTTASASCQPIAKDRTIQYTLTTSSGNGSATIVTQVSNDTTAANDAARNWITAATTTFASAASPQVDGFTMNTPWAFVRFNVTAISGTGATVTGTLGI